MIDDLTPDLRDAIDGRIAAAGGGGGGGSSPALAPGGDVTDTPEQDGYVVNQIATPWRLLAGGRDGEAHARTLLTGNALLAFGNGSADPAESNADLYYDSNDGMASDGYLSVGKGIIFPTSDPMIVGAWWNNSGVLTISAAT